MEALLEWIAPDPHIRSALSGRMTPGREFNPYQFLRFEALIQGIAEVEPNIFDYLSAVQRVGEANRHHHLLAEIAANGATIISTNFDTRIEQAAQEYAMPTFVLSARRRTPAPEDRLIKVHGSFPWKRGRNVTPRASLTQIGRIGFAFERFPTFQSWFEAVTENKQLVVVGYSACDSFDVVPLLENHSRAGTISWFGYSPDRSIWGAKRISARNAAPFPPKRDVHFAGHALTNLASNRATSLVNQFVGVDVHGFLKMVVRTSCLDDPLPPKGRTAFENLRNLRQTLFENSLRAPERKSILRILDDGLFGESYATDVEAKPVVRGKSVHFIESIPTFSKRSAEFRAYRALQNGRLRFVIAKTERVSRESGLLWGLIMIEWMKCFCLHAELQMSTGSNRDRRHELARTLLLHSQRAIYFASELAGSSGSRQQRALLPNILWKSPT